MSDLEDVIEEATRHQHNFLLNDENWCPVCGGPRCWMPIEGKLKPKCACELLEISK